MCGSRKFPYLTHGWLFTLTAPQPLWKFRFSFILFFKKFGLWDPHPLGISNDNHGVNIDIFWYRYFFFHQVVWYLPSPAHLAVGTILDGLILLSKRGDCIYSCGKLKELDEVLNRKCNQTWKWFFFDCRVVLNWVSKTVCKSCLVVFLVLIGQRDYSATITTVWKPL